MPKRGGLVVLAVVALVILGAAFVVAGNGAFAGTDGAGTAAIQASHPGYEPWFTADWAPRSTEIQSGLFALQAAIGAGIIGFVVGTLRERRRHRRPEGS